MAYATEHLPHTSAAKNAAYNVSNLSDWWGEKRLSDVTAAGCRAYARHRPPAAARRDLETLRAAIGHWHREYGPLGQIPAVVLPPKPQPRDRWLTRQEAAKLLQVARRTPHLGRFILIGLYTGSRSGDILRLQWSQIDLSSGVMRRQAPGTPIQRLKRAPPVRLGQRILSHLRRWKRLDEGRGHVIHYQGRPVGRIKRAWGEAVKRAGLAGTGVVPHCLRHTRATHLMQAGVDIWEASGSLGMSPEMLTRQYGHHHPDWQKKAAEA